MQNEESNTISQPLSTPRSAQVQIRKKHAKSLLKRIQRGEKTNSATKKAAFYTLSFEWLHLRSVYIVHSQN